MQKPRIFTGFSAKNFEYKAHCIIHKLSPSCTMEFLFDTIVFSYNNPIFYRISQISENEYQADPIEENRKTFKLRRQGSHWIAEGNSSQHHAEQIGLEIDDMQTIKTVKGS